MHKALVLCALVVVSLTTHAARLTRAQGDALLDSVYDNTYVSFARADSFLTLLKQAGTHRPYELEIAEGDLYYNVGKYHTAADHYERVLSDPEVLSDTAEYMSVLHRMVSSCEDLNKEVMKMHYIDELLEVATEANDSAMMSVAIFAMGKAVYYQNKKSKGYALMREAVGIMERSDYVYKYDNLRYNYNTLFIRLSRDHYLQEADSVLDRLYDIIRIDNENVPHIEGLSQKELKTYYANKAVVLHQMGRDAEARQYYERFCEAVSPNDADEYLITPYLYEMGMYDKMIEISLRREKRYQVQGDTISYHYSDALRQLGNAYGNKKDYRRAASYFERLAIVRDSIKKREQRSTILELETIYDVKHKDMLLQHRDEQLRWHNIMLGTLLIVLTLFVLLIVYGVWHYRIVRKKNRAMVAALSTIHYYHNRLQQRTPLQQVPEEATPAVADEKSREQLWFEQIDDIINREALFLNPNLTRNDIMLRVGIPKNDFAAVIKQYTGNNFSTYINTLRLEYATRMMNKYPNYTIEAIALMSGFSNRQNFCKLFSQHLGMSPTEYKNSLRDVE